MTHYVTAKKLEGVEAICPARFSFILKFEVCNFCTIEKILEIFGTCDVDDDPDGGVKVVVRGTPYVWFAEAPEHCTCKLVGEQNV